MGALFLDLHDVAQVLTEHIREETGIVDVQAGPPREATQTTDPAVRLTLLFSSPQPTHRNDPLEAGPGGTLVHPPLSLACSYLVTTSGSDGDDPVGAHHALGQVMRLYHDVPELRLPLSADPGSPPGVYSDLGDGLLSVTQVPITLEQIDHVWTSLSEQLQPWALFEVAPVQLISRRPDRPAPSVVRPGGLDLELLVGTRPDVVRVTPQPVRPGGVVRVDVASPSALDAVWVGGLRVQPGDLALELSGPAAAVDLSRSGLGVLAAGRHPLTVSSDGLASRTTSVELAEDRPLLDAPPVTPHDPAVDLDLGGRGLGAVEEIVAWPDAGIRSPGDVHQIAFTATGPGALTLHSAAGLADLPVAIATWRLAARLAGQTYTPYVVLEVER